MSAPRHFIPAAQWSDPRHVRGLRGERVALAFLTACGWRIEAHRFRLGRHDVDLVARRGEVIAFVEVKTRVGAAFGVAAEAVGWRKRRAIAKVAEVWRQRHGRPADVYRFDLVSVYQRPGVADSVDHIPDAWRLGEAYRR